MSNDDTFKKEKSGNTRRYLNALLILPFIGLLWLPFYNFSAPSLFGFPFFYWYQLLWVPLTSLIIFIVYKRNP